MESLYLIELAGEDPMTRTGIQPVRAARVEEDMDYLYFFASDGTISALFHRSAVRAWRESSESELDELERRIDARKLT
jgi:hypothetical protein